MSVRPVALVVVFVSLAVGASPAATRQEQEAAPYVATIRFTSDPSAVRAFWTPSRMAEAESRDVLLDSARGSPSPAVSSQPSGAPVRIEPLIKSFVGTRRPSGASTRNGPIPYTRYELPPDQYDVFPYVTEGKLFLSDEDALYVCSATAVNSANLSVVWTAGHCIFDDGSYVDSAMFVPAYRDGATPYGEWPAGSAVLPRHWIEWGHRTFDASHDMAALVVWPDAGGQRLADVVGGVGIAWNEPVEQSLKALGYPAGAPFTGETMWVCESGVGGQDATNSQPYPIAIGCDMTGGSSGGGWLIEDQYLNSNMSYGYDEEPEVSYGPYFGDAAAALYEEASSMDPTVSVPLPRLQHPMRLTLILRGHLIASGRLTATDGFSPCAFRAPVEIFLATPGRDRLVRRTTTAPNGSYSVALPDQAGRYIAYAPDGGVDDANYCGNARASKVHPNRLH